MNLRLKTQMCDKIVFDDHFDDQHCHDRSKIQKRCDKAVEDCLASLAFVLNWFVTSKILTKLLTALYADENLVYLMKILVMLYFL